MGISPQMKKIRFIIRVHQDIFTTPCVPCNLRGLIYKAVVMDLHIF